MIEIEWCWLVMTTFHIHPFAAANALSMRSSSFRFFIVPVARSSRTPIFYATASSVSLPVGKLTSSRCMHRSSPSASLIYVWISRISITRYKRANRPRWKTFWNTSVLHRWPLRMVTLGSRQTQVSLNSSIPVRLPSGAPHQDGDDGRALPPGMVSCVTPFTATCCSRLGMRGQCYQPLSNKTIMFVSILDLGHWCRIPKHCWWSCVIMVVVKVEYWTRGVRLLTSSKGLTSALWSEIRNAAHSTMVRGWLMPERVCKDCGLEPQE